MKTEHIIKLAELYEEHCLFVSARIKKLPNGKYRVLSEKGKNLGTSDTRSGAEKRLKQVEYFKHRDQGNAEDEKEIDLTTADDFSYSAIMRKLRKDATKEQVLTFLQIFKKQFDKAIKDKLQKPEKVALQNAVLKLSKLYKVKLSKKMIKKAAISEVGDPSLVGKYLADIIRFTLNRIAPEKRKIAIAKLRQKIYNMNERQLAIKEMPPSSAMGQSITFVKHILFNHDAKYIRAVLNSITRNLI